MKRQKGAEKGTHTHYLFYKKAQTGIKEREKKENRKKHNSVTQFAQKHPIKVKKVLLLGVLKWFGTFL